MTSRVSRAEEPLDHVVEEGAVLRRNGSLDERVELGVETGKEVVVEEILDDDGAIALKRVDQGLGGASAGRRWMSIPHPRKGSRAVS